MTQLLILQHAIIGWFQDHLSRDDERGASLVEYALLLALIAVIAIAALIFLGHSVSNTLNNVGGAINNA